MLILIEIVFWVLLIGTLGTGSYFLYQWIVDYNKNFKTVTINVLKHIAQVFDLKIGKTPIDFKSAAWDYPFITGQINSHNILIYVEIVYTNDSKDYQINIEMDTPSTLFFELYPNTFANQTFFGSTPVDFKDTAFEKAFSIRAIDTKAIQTIFNTELRQALLDNKAGFTNVRLICKNQKIHFAQSYVYPSMRDKYKTEALVRTLVLMLERISNHHLNA